MNKPNGAPPIAHPAALIGQVSQVGHDVDGNGAVVFIRAGGGELHFPLLGAVEIAGLLCMHAVQAQAEINAATEAAAKGTPVIHLAHGLPRKA